MIGFHRTLVRLTFLYVGILMLLSLVFSVWLYNVAGREIRSVLVGVSSSDVRRAEVEGDTPDDTSLIDESNQRLITDLVFFNLFVFGAGTLASYGLAHRTLRPIHESYQAQEQFVADASHELKTPLTALKAELQVARRGIQSGEYQKVFDSSLEEVERLSTLTSRLLSLTSDAQMPKEQESSVRDVMKTVRARTKHLAVAKSITIKQTVQSDLWVAIDQDDFIELLVILLDNAIKYSPKDSLVHVTAKHDQKQVVVTVHDTGPGVALDHIEHIFKRFYRADQAHSSEGHGLGLAIADRIVHNNGGTISVHNDTLQGAIFTVILPAVSH